MATLKYTTKAAKEAAHKRHNLKKTTVPQLEAEQHTIYLRLQEIKKITLDLQTEREGLRYKVLQVRAKINAIHNEEEKSRDREAERALAELAHQADRFGGDWDYEYFFVCTDTEGGEFDPFIRLWNSSRRNENLFNTHEQAHLYFEWVCNTYPQAGVRIQKRETVI